MYKNITLLILILSFTGNLIMVPYFRIIQKFIAAPMLLTLLLKYLAYYKKSIISRKTKKN